MTTRVFLSLGSNVGDRAANLRDAIARLRDAGVRVTRTSSIYETEPVDFLDQAWFLNCVVEGETELSARKLLEKLLEIPLAMGSKKEIPKGPRRIDVDLLLYGDAAISEPGLEVPHPRMLARRFVLEPLAEIAPEVRHPLWSGTASEMLAAARDRSAVRRYVE